jgi:AcrR family transcriptional regulator
MTTRRPPEPRAPRRAARATLDRERVVAAALALVDRDGVERFSLRRLAAGLGVTPMAIYNHVQGRRDLLQAVADRVVAGVAYPAASRDWRRTLRGCFRALRHACLAHPGAVPLIESADALPAAVFRPMEITLTALRAAGLPPRDALRAYFLLTTFTLGQVGYQTRGWSRGVDAAAALAAGRVAPEAFPAVARAAAGRGGWSFDAAFELGLEVIIAGLAQRARGAAR